MVWALIGMVMVYAVVTVMMIQIDEVTFGDDEKEGE